MLILVVLCLIAVPLGTALTLAMMTWSGTARCSKCLKLIPKEYFQYGLPCLFCRHEPLEQRPVGRLTFEDFNSDRTSDTSMGDLRGSEANRADQRHIVPTFFESRPFALRRVCWNWAFCTALGILFGDAVLAAIFAYVSFRFQRPLPHAETLVLYGLLWNFLVLGMSVAGGVFVEWLVRRVVLVDRGIVVVSDGFQCKRTELRRVRIKQVGFMESCLVPRSRGCHVVLVSDDKALRREPVCYSDESASKLHDLFRLAERTP